MVYGGVYRHLYMFFLEDTVHSRRFINQQERVFPLKTESSCQTGVEADLPDLPMATSDDAVKLFAMVYLIAGCNT